MALSSWWSLLWYSSDTTHQRHHKRNQKYCHLKWLLQQHSVNKIICINFGLEKLENTKGKLLQDKVGMFHFHWYFCQLLRSEVCQRSRWRQWNSWKFVRRILKPSGSSGRRIFGAVDTSANPIYGNQDVYPLANKVYFIVIIKKPPLRNPLPKWISICIWAYQKFVHDHLTPQYNA